MSGIRWTTGLGIAVGGTTGAIAALMGSPGREAKPIAPVSNAGATSALASAAAAPSPTSPLAVPAEPPRSASPPAPAMPTPLASAAVPPTAPSTTSSPIGPSPTLEVPSSRDALLKAMLFCDQKQDFDECARAAMALDLGSAGPANAEQAKRFRRIALTHLVAQCESGSAHACFVLATKYRAGTELPASATSAAALEKRGLELCRLGRSAPECPNSPH